METLLMHLHVTEHDLIQKGTAEPLDLNLIKISNKTMVK